MFAIEMAADRYMLYYNKNIKKFAKFFLKKC